MCRPSAFVAENQFDVAAGSSPSGFGGGTNNEQDRVTKFEYNGLGGVAKLIAFNGGSGSAQPTTYLFEHTHRADLVTNTIYPDSGDSTSSGTDQVAMEYDLDGRIKKHKGQGNTETARTIHEYTYNGRRQLELDGVTQLGTGIDSTIQSIKRTHDSLGRLEYVISCSGNNGTGTIENELKHTYHATLGLLTKTQQSHQNAITFGTPSVQYAYDETAASSIYNDGLRLETVTYPEGRVIFSDYGTGDAINDRLHRVNRVRETNSSGTILTQYSYNGVGRNVITDYQPPDVNLIL